MQKHKITNLTLVLMGVIFTSLVFVIFNIQSEIVSAYQIQEEYFAHLPVIHRSGDNPPPSPTTQPTPPPNPTPQPTLSPVGDAIIVDRTSIDLFDQIPDQYLTAARNIKMVFMDRSVGQNINEALNCLAARSWVDAPSYCRRHYYDENWNWKTFSADDYRNNEVPSVILFEPDPVKYDRSNWTFQYHAGGWEALTEDFVTVQFPAYVNQNDILTYQFSYLNIEEGSTIDGEWSNGNYYPGYLEGDPGNSSRWDISDIEALEAQYPNKLIFHWTTSLARIIGTADGENFNHQMREYAILNDKILFDVADILSHDPAGQLCYDSRDGDCYCNSNQCEDYSIYGQSCDWDDGVERIAICQDYTTETLGGHLGSVSGGKIRIAKAFWVLMARIAGWDGISQ